MAEEKRRVKRAEVSDKTRAGRHRAAVNPHAKTEADGGALRRAQDSLRGTSRGGRS